MINKESLHKELDSIFKENGKDDYVEDAVLFFYDEKITQILKEIVGEELDLKTVALIDKKQVERGGGWNSKRSEIIEKTKEMGWLVDN